MLLITSTLTYCNVVVYCPVVYLFSMYCKSWQHFLCYRCQDTACRNLLTMHPRVTREKLLQMLLHITRLNSLTIANWNRHHVYILLLFLFGSFSPKEFHMKMIKVSCLDISLEFMKFRCLSSVYC